jgi:ribosomal peptide maturation radical SAM protein 1
MNVKQPKVLLLQMPWASTGRPSIALGILKQLCARSGVPCATFYPNMDITAMVGFGTAVSLSDERLLFGVSEHLFAAQIFGCKALGSDKFLESFTSLAAGDLLERTDRNRKLCDVDYLRSLRDEIIPDFLEALLKRVLAEAPTIVGVTGTFNQVMSALAIAHRIKAADPKIEIIAGGACFDGEMGIEYHRAFPAALDHVFLGEAEDSFLEYIERHKRGLPIHGIGGITSWIDGRVDCPPGKAVKELDSSPMPDYDDFFAEAERARIQYGLVFNAEFLPFESSRGCWWGQTNHCVFCGINDDLIGFRAKSVDRVVSEIVKLSARYGITKLAATDWIISRAHCDELFAKLKALDLDLELFYEVRADMSKSQIKAMREAGIARIQPGIESFSTPLLKLMKKGSMGIRHVQFLRHCRELGFSVEYNMLGGFPGERAEWYADMALLIPRLRHLEPPSGRMVSIEMHRFAPFFEQRDKFGVDQVTLRRDYGNNFPPGLLDLTKIAYFFNFSCSQILAEETYNAPVSDALESWIEAHKGSSAPKFEYAVGAGFLRITDTRFGEGRFLHLAGLHQDIVLLCDEVQSRRKLAEALAPIYTREIEDGILDKVVDELLKADVLMEEGPYLLTLPIAKKTRTTEELRGYVLGAAVSRTEAHMRPAYA